MLLVKLGITDNKDHMNIKSFFRPIYIFSEPGRVWVTAPYISGCSVRRYQELYEAAKKTVPEDGRRHSHYYPQHFTDHHHYAHTYHKQPDELINEKIILLTDLLPTKLPTL
jgi:hypothetical protein